MSESHTSPHDFHPEIRTDGEAEARLLAAVKDLEVRLERVLQLAREIGPEWENVVAEMERLLVEQLAELSHRLSERLRRP